MGYLALLLFVPTLFGLILVLCSGKPRGYAAQHSIGKLPKVPHGPAPGA